jgi:G protein-coupled receptor 107
MNRKMPRHAKHPSPRLLVLVTLGMTLLLSSWMITPCLALKHNFKTKNDDRYLIGPIGFPFGFLDSGLYNLTVYDFSVEIGIHDEHGQGATDDDAYHHIHPGNTRYLLLPNDNDNNNEDESQLKHRQLLFGKKKKKHEEEQKEDPSSTLDNAIDRVGFLLKRFDNEGAFNQYMANILDSGECALPKVQQDVKEDDDLFVGTDGGGGDFGDMGSGNAGSTAAAAAGKENNPVVVTNAAENGIFLSMKDKTTWGSAVNRVEYGFHNGDHGLYFLLFQICPSDASAGLHLHVQFELDFHFSNLDIFGKESYLSAGEMILPHLFFYFSILYSICLFLWVDNLRKIKRGEPGHWPALGSTRPVIYPIHYLMAALLALKTMTIFFDCIRYHYLRVSGKAVLWSAVYYTFSFMKGTFLFTVILLIGSGWSFVKPFLNDRERSMIMGILILQVINNIAIIVLTQEAEGEKSYEKWTAILHMVDILCCCAVLIPIVWQVNQLEKNIEQSNGDHSDRDDNSGDNGSNGDLHIPEDELDDVPLASNGGRRRRGPANDRLVSKLRLFRRFYLMVVSYIYITRIVVYLFATMLDYRHIWLQHFVVEAVTIAFYCMVGMQFRPMGENPYLSIRDREKEDYEQEIELTS